ncbi:MAG: GIN domain-containing protein [Brevefilum sp.]
MPRIRHLMIALLFAFLISGCSVANIFLNTVHGSGEVVIENRDVDSFSKIEANGDLELFVTQVEPGIEVHAESNLMKYIHTYVEDQTLFVEIADTDGARINLQPLEPIQVYVMLTKITDIQLSGSVDLKAGQLIAEQMEMNLILSGESTAKINAVRTDLLNVNLSGASELEIVDGQVSEQFLEASGESDYQAEWLKSENTTILLSGGSEAVIWAEENFEVDLSGGSTAYYYGSPNKLSEIKNTGGSDYISKGER